MTDLFARWFSFKPTPQSAARELALHGAELRRMSERQRKVAMNNILRAEMGKGPDPRLVA